MSYTVQEVVARPRDLTPTMSARVEDRISLYSDTVIAKTSG